MMTRSTARRARSHHRCDCGTAIHPGSLYIEHVAAPGYIGNSRWQRLAECEGCAARYGRGHLIDARFFNLPELCSEVTR